MSIALIDIFLEHEDTITLAEDSNGKYAVHIGDRTKLFFVQSLPLDEFMKRLNTAYDQTIARKEARRARKDNGSRTPRAESYGEKLGIKVDNL